MNSDRLVVLENGKSYRQLYEEGAISDAQLRSVVLLFLACTGRFDIEADADFYVSKLREWGLDEKGNKILGNA
jgi:hypothetical protein